MSNFFENTATQASVQTRSILRNVYVWMTLALTVTGIVAFALGQNTGFVLGLFNSGAIWAVLIGQIVLVFAISGFVMKMSPAVATGVFALYSVLMGVTLSSIFMVYEIGSIATAFFISAGMFAGMSVYAITTKRDLTGMGNILFMALIGLVIASLVNFFLKSSMMDYIISFAGVVIFSLLTAYDTQKIKRMSDATGTNIVEADYLRLSILGALTLYLDFINIFLFLLRLFGGSSRD
jgi:FtsH-binding integral membrane protein